MDRPIKRPHFRREDLLTLAAALTLSAIIPFVAMAAAGCTVTPKVVAPPPAPDYVGNVENGGIIDEGVPPGQKPDGHPAHVVKEWVDAYAALARKYGQDMTPAVSPGDGVTFLGDYAGFDGKLYQNVYLVDLEHLADKNVMATLQRSGISP